MIQKLDKLALKNDDSFTIIRCTFAHMDAKPKVDGVFMVRKDDTLPENKTQKSVQADIKESADSQSLSRRLKVADNDKLPADGSSRMGHTALWESDHRVAIDDIPWLLGEADEHFTHEDIQPIFVLDDENAADSSVRQDHKLSADALADLTGWLETYSGIGIELKQNL